jgi:class 3 adenylate cyclase/tetratricopeptide (TPR) repeat protein
MTGRDGVTEGPAPSGTVTFLFSDIEGSTQRWDRDRAAMQEAVRLHDTLMRAAIARYGGHVFKTIGDAFCAAFATPESAARSALDGQRALGDADFSAVGGLRVRMAINTGTADERDGDYFGPTVNRVARLLSLVHGGQVLLSGIAAGLVRENPPPQTTLAELGAHGLKDLERHEDVYQLVAPGLQRDFPELRAHKPLDRPWLVPSAMRTLYFAGREDLLALLRRQLAERHRAALCGLGGVGKSQAAIEYAVRHRADYPDGVFWTNAETASGLTSGFVEIAKTLRLPAAASSDHEQVVRAVQEWLRGADRWLLILDNVDDRREIRRFVPDRGKGDVLITSRESVFAELGIPRALEVRDLDSDEALRFLLTRTGHEDGEPGERSAATELAAELGNLPLALEQAAAYIAETNASFSSYLSAFRKRRVTLLERAGGLVSHDTVGVTWSANFEAVERASAAAADVLRVGAFLAPDAIPFEVFSKGAHALGGPIAEAVSDPDELAIAELFRPLARYSLIRADTKLHAYGVHRLVQEIVRAEIVEGERRVYVERTVSALNAAFPEVDYETWAQCDRLVPHVVSIAGWVESYDLYPASGNELFSQAGRYLIERGRYHEAEPLVARALTIAERSLGPDHPDLARNFHNLGLVNYYLGRNAAAEPLYKRALAIRERAFGPDHPEVANTLNNIANVYFTLGRYAEGQPLYERNLAIWERAHGPDSPSVATGLNNLGEVLERQGRYAEALPLLERALAIRERALGPDHPHVALSFSNLGELFCEQGRPAEAQRMHERALAIREPALGPDHEDVAVSLSGLAMAYEQQSRYAEAQPLYERAREIWERALGRDHPDVAQSLDGLASLNVKQGRHAAAEPLYQRALAIRERALGSDHPNLAATLVGLASLRADQGRSADAVPLLERALAIKERTFAADHPELVAMRNTLDALRSATKASASSGGQV